MSYLYDEYLYDHRKGVQDAYCWLVNHGIVEASSGIMLDIHDHDKSKNDLEEYSAYDNYFYGNRSAKVVEDFNYAWLHHIHHNPHHWQYWVLQHDDEPEEALEMPKDYVIEMICDWWSFSFKYEVCFEGCTLAYISRDNNKNLYGIFDWYEKHKGMKLHPKTRKLVEDILKKIREELDKEKEEEQNHDAE